MPGVTGLLEYKEKYPERFFDVGIAEEHAVSMAGGLAKQGMTPVIALYSTFLQRAYDMILQDICMLNLHAVFAIDRAGLVGEDGETHHGIYDIGFLRQATNMTVLCPASLCEQSEMLCWAVKNHNGPVAIRYPRGGDRDYKDSAWKGSFSAVCHRKGCDATVVCYGTMLQNALDAAKKLAENGIEVTVLRLLSVKPLPVDDVLEQSAQNAPIVIVEETSGNCGIRDSLAYELRKKNPARVVAGLDLGDRFIPHGSVEQLYEYCGLNGQKIAEFVQEVCGK